MRAVQLAREEGWQGENDKERERKKMNTKKKLSWPLLGIPWTTSDFMLNPKLRKIDSKDIIHVAFE